MLTSCRWTCRYIIKRRLLLWPKIHVIFKFFLYYYYKEKRYELQKFCIIIFVFLLCTSVFVCKIFNNTHRVMEKHASTPSNLTIGRQFFFSVSGIWNKLGLIFLKFIKIFADYTNNYFKECFLTNWR